LMFHHTNARFGYEPFLQKFMIVPSLHRVHHSAESDEHNHNYGTMLTLWDWLFGTLSVIEPESIGSKDCPPESVFNLIKYGFGWEAENCTKRPVNLELMIAEAAFYKAEKRNFKPGHELLDWLEAKTEILTDINNHT